VLLLLMAYSLSLLSYRTQNHQARDGTTHDGQQSCIQWLNVTALTSVLFILSCVNVCGVNVYMHVYINVSVHVCMHTGSLRLNRENFLPLCSTLFVVAGSLFWSLWLAS